MHQTFYSLLNTPRKVAYRRRKRKTRDGCAYLPNVQILLRMQFCSRNMLSHHQMFETLKCALTQRQNAKEVIAKCLDLAVEMVQRLKRSRD